MVSIKQINFDNISDFVKNLNSDESNTRVDNIHVRFYKTKILDNSGKYDFITKSFILTAPAVYVYDFSNINDQFFLYYYKEKCGDSFGTENLFNKEDDVLNYLYMYGFNVIKDSVLTVENLTRAFGSCVREVTNEKTVA